MEPSTQEEWKSCLFLRMNIAHNAAQKWQIGIAKAWMLCTLQIWLLKYLLNKIKKDCNNYLQALYSSHQEDHLEAAAPVKTESNL